VPNCPFCAISPDRLVLATDLVVAIRDAYPVSPGHTLVIPRRHIATFFDTTPQERVAIGEAVVALKVQLDAELHPKPDGYNVGFNAGQAAGQTVMHLHVHVIPRYAGDLLNPRGGVRAVIPHKADYLASPQGIADLTHGPERPLQPWLFADLARAATVDIAVAFVWPGGVERIYPYLETCLDRGGRIRVLTGDYGDTTDPAALRHLLDLVKLDPERAKLRIFEVARAGDTTFHPKAYLVSSSGPHAHAVAWVGSSNLSEAALQKGVEWNLRLAEPDGVAKAQAAFEDLFAHPATREIDDAWIDAYVRRRRLAPRSARTVPLDIAPEPAATPPDPHEIQREALAALQATRAEGNCAGLVVLATGLGKTWLSAFDSLRFPRVLFVAHREEILRQALATYRAIRPGDRLGLFTGERKDLHADVLFASIQTLARPGNLAAFDSRHFHYIVVDEFHHADARTYRRLIQHFAPNFLLGLTATPERTDGGDLLALCGENLVFRCDLGEGIARGRLVPFHYFGVPDLVDYTNIPWRSRRFDEEALTRAVETQARADNALQQWRRHGHGRTLGFCVSQHHANFMRGHFRAAGLRTASVHSGASSDPRADALTRLEEGDLDILFAVDMFNEGLDLRHIETVLMLRPTESKILWLQQIGRGLRKADGKEHLRIVDYIGNHRVFLNKPAALLEAFGIRTTSPADILSKLAILDTKLPPGCAVTYELQALDTLSDLVPRSSTSNALRDWYVDFRDRTGVRPTAPEAFREGYNPASLRAAYGSWHGFVESMGDLDPERQAVLSESKSLLVELETTEMTRSYKLVLVQALLWLDALPGRASLDALTKAFARVAGRSAELRRDVSVDLDDKPALRALLLKNPIAAWLGRRDPSGRAWFVREGDELATGPALVSAHRDALCDLVAELVEWRIARYIAERTTGPRFRVLRNASGDPILKIDRKKADLPTGWVDVAIDGEPHQAKFAKELVDVLRHKDQGNENVLPKVMYRWFGDDAGKRGTAFGVSHAAEEGGGYSWSPVRAGKPMEGRAIVRDDGKEIDARYDVEAADDGAATIVLMSRGGGRNDEYTLGMRLVLQRLAAAGLEITRIEVASSEMEGRPPEERVVEVAGAAYPIRLAEVADLEMLRKAIGKGIAMLGRRPGAKGSGNANKRVRIWVGDVGLAELGRVVVGTRV
jgi:superfamily II DNA or RNA helicase/diadenosine tetraphosphate (Ap4A) HIT family hydrolase/HKD family nuclease